MKINFYTLWFLLLLCFSLEVSALPAAKFIFKVVDEASNPISGADVSTSFYGYDTIRVSGLSDSSGIFTVVEDTSGLVKFGAKKEGYYLTIGQLGNFKEFSGIKGFRRWQPWGIEITLVLKKIKNPIALYAANLHSSDIPFLNRFVGFDLIERDWVVPYGKGLNTDFLFKVVQRRAINSRDYDVDLIVSFPNKHDGIVIAYGDDQYGSELRLPHHAPLTGYQHELVINLERTPGVPIHQDDNYFREINEKNYFFRTRSKVDEEGNLVFANYGKIHGLIELMDFYEKSMTGKIKFTYYFNPTANDTNLEFDPQKNIYGERSMLPDALRVGNP